MDAASNRRFLHLTPDRVLLTLLPIWGALFLCQHFGWLSKGYPVLLAVATLTAILLLVFLWFVVALVFRRRFQFSIRSLLLLTLVVSIWGSWFGVEMRLARRQREMVMTVLKLGGTVRYDGRLNLSGSPNSQPQGSVWLRRVLGEDFFATVDQANLTNSEATDGDVEGFIKGLTQLWSLYLNGTQVTDAGLENLKGLTQLQGLHLGGTQVGDAGLEHLKGLTQLQWLNLDGTKISDMGLENLNRLTQLQGLYLSNTKVSDAGLENINGLTQLQDLLLSGTQITDAGLENLKGLTQLQYLALSGTQATGAGLERLKGLTQLQYLFLNETQMTDAGLERLKGLTQLQGLWLERTKVTDEGMKKLQQALPNCRIYH